MKVALVSCALLARPVHAPAAIPRWGKLRFEGENYPRPEILHFSLSKLQISPYQEVSTPTKALLAHGEALALKELHGLAAHTVQDNENEM